MKKSRKFISQFKLFFSKFNFQLTEQKNGKFQLLYAGFRSAAFQSYLSIDF